MIRNEPICHRQLKSNQTQFEIYFLLHIHMEKESVAVIGQDWEDREFIEVCCFWLRTLFCFYYIFYFVCCRLLKST